jgi:hypothetical protein
VAFGDTEGIRTGFFRGKPMIDTTSISTDHCDLLRISAEPLLDHVECCQPCHDEKLDGKELFTIDYRHKRFTVCCRMAAEAMKIGAE